MPTRFSAGSGASATLRNVDVPVTMTSAFSASSITTLAVDGLAGDDDDLPPDHGEVDQPEGQLGRAGGRRARER